MADLQKDLLNLQYSSAINISGVQEEVINLTLPAAHDVETSISGTVTDSSKPVSGATVKVFDQKGNPFMHTVTDSDGSYLFENLPAGTYSVAVACNGYQLSPGKSTSLSSGDTAVLDFSLTKDASQSLGVVSGVISTIQNGTSTPLGGVKASLMDSKGDTVAVTYSVDDGEFAFYDLVDGQYQILATSQGYMPSQLVTVTITDGSIINTTIQLVLDSTTNSGTVNGVIKDNNGNIVASCFVGLYQIVKNEDGTTGEILVAYTKTNAWGQYLFGNVLTGNYVVKAKMNA